MATAGIAASFAGPLDSRDRDAVTALGRVLRTHGFAGAAVPAALGGPLRSKDFLRTDLSLYLRRLAASTPINTLIKLFMLDQWVEERSARAALAPLDLRDVRLMGLIEESSQGVRARVRLSSYCDLILAHDRYDGPSAHLSEDHVLDVNPTTVTLASLMVRRPARSALDLGTGCGVLALLAARHSERVVGIDLNARALNVAAFNGLLNGVDHVEWRQGNLFEPVAGTRFDLVVCNPPYVISPETQYVFRDSGRKGDALCEEVVRRVPDYLEDGGFASILCNWALAPGEAWSAPLRRWVERSRCDSWLLYGTAQDPLTYAAGWNRSPDRTRYEQALGDWTAYCDELGIASIGMGAVILRRRAEGVGWIRADSMPENAIEPCDVHVRRIFQSQDYLSTVHDDGALLAHAFQAADDLRLHHTLSLKNGEYVVDRSEIQLTGGLQFKGSVDAYTIHLMARCDGRRTVDEVVTELAMKGGAARDQVATACAAIVRRLVALGFLIPVTAR